MYRQFRPTECVLPLATPLSTIVQRTKATFLCRAISPQFPWIACSALAVMSPRPYNVQKEEKIKKRLVGWLDGFFYVLFEYTRWQNRFLLYVRARPESKPE